MLPPKNSIYRSWDNLCKFMGDDDVRQIGSRCALHKGSDLIVLCTQNNAMLVFQEGGIFIGRPTFRTKPKYAEVVNPILALFGWYYGEITFGPHRKHWRGLKPLRISPGTPECDYRSIIPKGGAVMYKILWNGKISEHGGKLTEYQVQRNLKSYEVRAAASKNVRRCAYYLGFPNTAKMNGYKLPKDKSLENVEKLNSLARGYGYAHVAHAWANGFVIPTDPLEVDMLTAGVVHLVKDAQHEKSDANSKKSLYEMSDKLWLRQRILKGEPPHDLSW